jgi:hypothetical protein
MAPVADASSFYLDTRAGVLLCAGVYEERPAIIRIKYSSRLARSVGATPRCRRSGGPGFVLRVAVI